MEERRVRGLPMLTWEDYVKRDLAGIGGEWIIRVKDRRSGDDSETGSEEEGNKKFEDGYRCQPHPGLQR